MPRDDQRSDRSRAVQEFAVLDQRRVALTIFRTTYSGVLKDNMDYSTAKLDPFGNIVIDVSVPEVSARLFG